MGKSHHPKQRVLRSAQGVEFCASVGFPGYYFMFVRKKQQEHLWIYLSSSALKFQIATITLVFLQLSPSANLLAAKNNVGMDRNEL